MLVNHPTIFRLIMYNSALHTVILVQTIVILVQTIVTLKRM